MAASASYGAFDDEAVEMRLELAKTTDRLDLSECGLQSLPESQRSPALQCFFSFFFFDLSFPSPFNCPLPNWTPN